MGRAEARVVLAWHGLERIVAELESWSADLVRHSSIGPKGG